MKTTLHLAATKLPEDVICGIEGDGEWHTHAWYYCAQRDVRGVKTKYLQTRGCIWCSRWWARGRFNFVGWQNSLQTNERRTSAARAPPDLTSSNMQRRSGSRRYYTTIIYIYIVYMYYIIYMSRDLFAGRVNNNHRLG